MIRKLTKQDHQQLFDYLKAEASINLFMIGDLEVFGYETDFQDIWADVGADGNYRGVLLRFYGAYIPYSQTNEFDTAAFAEIIRGDAGMEMLNGKQECVERLLESGVDLPLKPKRETYFAELVNADQLDAAADTGIVKLATLDDVDRIIALRAQISEFASSPNARESLVKVMESGMARTFYIEEDGEMIACASTTAENSISAMIVGVCTRNEHRGKGYASLIMTALCRQLLSEGRTLCLFYDNPSAGVIYKRLGFRDIGIWTMMPRDHQ